MDKILSLLTKENITFLIAVLGFLLSLYNFLRDILQLEEFLNSHLGNITKN